MKNRRLIVLGLSLALSGCLTTGGSDVLQTIVDTSRGALAKAEAYKCKIAPLGSVNWYYNTPELMAAKDLICRRSQFLKTE